MPLVAGIDASTQSTTVEVRDVDSGAVVARGRAPHRATTPPISEQDPAARWQAFEVAWAAVEEQVDAGACVQPAELDVDDVRGRYAEARAGATP